MVTNVNISRLPVLISALLISSNVVACFKADPRQEGQNLGEKHVELIQKKKLTLDALMKDLEPYEQKYREDSESLEKFNRGYQKAIEPVKAEIAKMIIESYGDAAAQAAAKMMRTFGKGVGEMVNEFAKQLEGKDFEKAMESFGRGMGKFMKEVGKGMGEMTKEFEKASKSP